MFRSLLLYPLKYNKLNRNIIKISPFNLLGNICYKNSNNKNIEYNNKKFTKSVDYIIYKNPKKILKKRYGLDVNQEETEKIINKSMNSAKNNIKHEEGFFEDFIEMLTNVIIIIVCILFMLAIFISMVLTLEWFCSLSFFKGHNISIFIIIITGILTYLTRFFK